MFQFKQFTVHHDQCAMKVGTDGVLLGAWTNVDHAQRILDVGTGSGLIALMLAQRSPFATIVGIDVCENAVSQAKENVAASPFSDRIEIILSSVQDFAKHYQHQFDMVVSNPPFFTQSLHSPSKERTLARHTQDLTLEALFASTSQLLFTNGTFSLIYPIDQLQNVLDCATKYDLFLIRQTIVFPTPHVPPKRVLLEFSKQQHAVTQLNNLIIEEERHRYSNEFQALTKDFYLKL